MRACVAALAFVALPALAETPMTGDEFEAYTTGRTLLYGNGGETYGAETYRPGREVIWSFLDGRCDEGYWFAEADTICFVYEAAPDPVCWAFFRTDTGLTASITGGDALRLDEIGDAPAPLACPGPDVGV